MTFDVKGMTCAACSAHVEKSVRRLEGVNDVSVSLLTNSMEVRFDPAVVTPDALYVTHDLIGGPQQAHHQISADKPGRACNENC